MFTKLLLLLILVAAVHAFRQLEDEGRGEIEECRTRHGEIEEHRARRGEIEERRAAE